MTHFQTAAAAAVSVASLQTEHVYTLYVEHKTDNVSRRCDLSGLKRLHPPGSVPRDSDLCGLSALNTETGAPLCALSAVTLICQHVV